ncbi:MAG: hypothetical protein QNL03_09955, partial [Gammaproteobacteria bacterium]|nr:hypothetical protein [Gammaproteobacteria bacterium]
QLAGTDVFKPLFLEYRVSHAMPDYQPTLTGLGVTTHQHGHESDISLRADAADADIRINIYKGDVR